MANKSKAAKIAKAMKAKQMEVTLFSSPDSLAHVTEYMSSGSIVLDRVLGQGWPVGRISEVYGDTSTGKSLIAAQTAAYAQEEGDIVFMLDSESAAGATIMEAVGVDMDELIYSAPDTVEEVFQQMDAAIELKRKLYPDDRMLLIWDSIAATSSKAEMVKTPGDLGYTTHARVISQEMRRMSREISKERICALFLNQIRENIGVMFGDKETTFGGKAVRFHSSIRLELKSGKKIKATIGKKQRVIGIHTRATTTKNKVFAPFQDAELPIYFGHGIDDAEASRLWLEEFGLAKTKKGNAWRTLELASGEIKYQANTWNAVFDKYFDEIVDLIFMDVEAIEEDEPDSDN